ncbi:hypothetical protein Lp16_D025 (plasmid) [Lactiplantibacillus plantarum 16]|nr:hypothetical protein Lp16_D025 [Lactiplantibacillus plantarum 16]
MIIASYFERLLVYIFFTVRYSARSSFVKPSSVLLIVCSSISSTLLKLSTADNAFTISAVSTEHLIVVVLGLDFLVFAFTFMSRENILLGFGT